MSEEHQVIDVVSVARELLESKGIFWERTAVPGDQLLVIPPQDHPQVPLQISVTPETCQFGHPNPTGGKFCPECGLRTGIQVMDMEAVLAPPKPADELTPEEKQQREIEHQQALSLNAAMDRESVPDFQSSTGDKIVIHFVDDGFTALGHVWLRGQQIAIGPDHPRWPDAIRWINMTPDEQINTYGKQHFARGPVPREETAQEQYRQVEIRRAYGRAIMSDVPDQGLLNAEEL